MSDVTSAEYREALRQRIEQQVQLTVEPVCLGGRDFEWFRVADAEQLLEAAVVATTEDPRPEELDPFWAATWRAALGLDQFLGTLPLQSIRVLELGCGSGQAGVGAAARGATVTMTDVVELALLVAELNAVPVARRVRFARLNWSEGGLDAAPFPLIIGSDLVYDPALFPLLDSCARRHLAPGGKLLLSEPHRHTGDKFADWIRKAGWLAHEHSIDLDDDRVPIRIFECTIL